MILDVAGKITPHPSIATQNLILLIIFVVAGVGCLAVAAYIRSQKRKNGDSGKG